MATGYVEIHSKKLQSAEKQKEKLISELHKLDKNILIGDFVAETNDVYRLYISNITDTTSLKTILDESDLFQIYHITEFH